MAMSSSNPQTYMTQWLQTATNGTVHGEFSLMHNRMRLRCLKCGLTLTCPSPEGTTIDYGVQEFVKLHAHKEGGWKCFNCGEVINKSITEHAPECKPAAWQGVTADFKKIDVKPEMAQKIISATQAVADEYSAKLNNDEEFAKKIAALQKGDKGKGNDQSKSNWIPKEKKAVEVIDPNTGQKIKAWEWVDVEDDFDAPTATDEELANITKAAAATKAIENALKIKLLQAQLDSMKGIENHVAPKTIPKPATSSGGEILTIKTGRKFR
jgi:hypothetical protein